MGNTFFLSLEDLVFHISSAPFLVPCGCSVLCSAGGPSIQRCPLCVTCTSVVIVGGTFTAGDLGAQTLSQLSFRSHCPLWRAQLCLQQLVGRIVCKSRESRAKALSQESVFASGYFRILDSRPCLKRLGTGREHSAPSCSPPDSGVLRAVLEGSSFKVLWSLLAGECTPLHRLESLVVSPFGRSGVAYEWRVEEKVECVSNQTTKCFQKFKSVTPVIFFLCLCVFKWCSPVCVCTCTWPDLVAMFDSPADRHRGTYQPMLRDVLCAVAWRVTTSVHQNHK